jgi:hypothetical protein
MSSVKRNLRKIRRSRVTKNELIADIIFFTVPAIIALIAVFIFDIHHSFYPENYLSPVERIFLTYDPYWIGTLLGGVAGFFLIKLLLFGLKEEES